jgi:ribonuclease R
LGYAAGTYWDSGRKFGFVTPDGAKGREEDIFLPPHCSGKAWHGDRVLVELDLRQMDEGRMSGHVVKLLQRGESTCQGRLEKVGQEYYVQPEGGRLPALKVAGGHSGLRKGDKVQAKILSYGGRRVSPLCQVTAVYGKDGTRKAAVEGILAQHKIVRQFPQAVLEEAEAAPQTVAPAARRGRLDLREQQIITIDGPYAKDLDDAVSLEPTETGWRLGVHIADVSHYVKEGSALDTEALNRGTSVYFADQVVPMLPEKLSNGICSLNPQVERLTLSCIMEVDKSGRVTDYTIAKSVIKTAERMSYPDCNTLLAGGDAALEERYAAILPMLREMAVLSRKLEGLRKQRGALELTSSAVSILCNDRGEPIGLAPDHTGESEKIIESFMLLANETVARHLVKNNLPGVFRVHQEPTAEKLERLRGLISPFGYTLDTPDAFGMQKLLKAAQGTQEETAISMALLRSLMKARYEGENQGHFGLGAEYYCHFTSPIRRYPDLMVHRILSQSLTANPRLTHFRKQVGAVAQQSSYREVEAETAQREAEKCYLAEYMQSHVGEKYPGVISGITRNGLFVLLPNGAEGRVAVETMPGYYDYDEEGMTLTGGNPRTVYRFALPVTVVVAAADPGTGLIDLTLDGVPASPPQSHRREEKAFFQKGKKGKGKGRNQRAVSVPRKKGKRKR